jgi:hypothetical protein
VPVQAAPVQGAPVQAAVLAKVRDSAVKAVALEWEALASGLAEAEALVALAREWAPLPLLRLPATASTALR